MIEKHFTLDRSLPGPDHRASLEPDELKLLCQSVHEAWSALGSVRLEPSASEKPNLIFRRSLYVTADMKPGEVFTADNVRSVRPSLGLPPADLPRIYGRKARQVLTRGTPLSWNMVEGGNS